MSEFMGCQISQFLNVAIFQQNAEAKSFSKEALFREGYFRSGPFQGYKRLPKQCYFLSHYIILQSKDSQGEREEGDACNER